MIGYTTTATTMTKMTFAESAMLVVQGGALGSPIGISSLATSNWLTNNHGRKQRIVNAAQVLRRNAAAAIVRDNDDGDNDNVMSLCASSCFSLSSSSTWLPSSSKLFRGKRGCSFFFFGITSIQIVESARYPFSIYSRRGRSRTGDYIRGHLTGLRQAAAIGPRAFTAISAPVAQGKSEYELGGGAGLLKITTTPAAPGVPAMIELQIASSNVSSFILHWGATKPGKGKWYLPSKRPSESWDYKHQAVQSRFVKEQDRAVVVIELEDPGFNGIEFLLKEENGDRWFKHKGRNFRVDVPSESHADITVPDELIGIQAYLRWEKDGKKKYSAEQDRENFEAALRELQMEISRGTSVNELRSRLIAGRTADPTPDEDKKRKKKISDGQKTALVSVQRIKRKSRDAMELLNPVVVGPSGGQEAGPPRELTPLELASKVLEETEGGVLVLRKLLKLGSSDLLVLVTSSEGQTKVRLATNLNQGPVVLHWAVSKKEAREWLVTLDTRFTTIGATLVQAPVEKLVPEGSTCSETSVETPFKDGFAGNASLKSVEINFGDTDYIGMPFVCKVGEEWWKENGRDFYVSLKSELKKPQMLFDGVGTGTAILHDIANSESEAERSLMHRYNIASAFAERAKSEGGLALVGVFVWLRYMATRQLTWNKNYNVKPREISAAQDRLTDMLQSIYLDQLQNRDIVRLIMLTVGRGGQGDVGQRIRDEILLIQRKNDCKGGMMEEWHQKLHNNTSPDDVVICQALLEYIKNDFNLEFYWKTLTENGLTRERLRSYDRPIVSEPDLRRGEKSSLIRDLTAYLRTLKAVHSGADLESAVAVAMGYSLDGQEFMGRVDFRPIGGLSPDMPGLLRYVLHLVESHADDVSLLEGLLEARRELRPNLLRGHDRLRDSIFLDLALDSKIRTTVEKGLESLKNAGPKELLYVISLVVENLALSTQSNEELVYILKDWNTVVGFMDSNADQWALRTKSVLDRTRLALQERAEHYQKLIQPTAEYLGTLLGVDQWAIDIFSEEIIRGDSAASLSQLLNLIDPVIRKQAHMGSWQVISPVETKGEVLVVDELLTVEDRVFEKPTIIVAGKVRGEEEIPLGAVGVLTLDMPDVLSHVAVRARNEKILFASCFDTDVFAELRALSGSAIKVQLVGVDIKCSEIGESELSETMFTTTGNVTPPRIILKNFSGKFAVSSDEFTPELVGSKSRNISHLIGRLPSWINLPQSVALPFGVFERVLADPINEDVAAEVATLQGDIASGDFHKLKVIRKAVLNLKAPPVLIRELEAVMKKSKMPWPGDVSMERWEQAWTAIKRVWGSKWNERAYFSTRKLEIDHDNLCMSVLVQEIICADYAFVIHTTNPCTGDSSEIYAEVVKGMGETLVGAYSGRALSFVARKSDLKKPSIQGYPSKRIGLFIKPSIIFRSDSNGEDLEGYAGAGLYDSVPMDNKEERVVDYSCDRLIVDFAFQEDMLSKISAAGAAIEELYGSAQDIEGVLKDGQLYIVQTRPQMQI